MAWTKLVLLCCLATTGFCKGLVLETSPGIAAEPVNVEETEDPEGTISEELWATYEKAFEGSPPPPPPTSTETDDDEGGGHEVMMNFAPADATAEPEPEMMVPLGAGEDASNLTQAARLTALPKPLPIKPYPFNADCPHPCCDSRTTTLNLHYRAPGVINNLFDSVEVLQPPYWWGNRAACSHAALLKVRFDKITRYPCYGLCMNSPFCGRRMLKIELELHRYQRSSYIRRMFNFGDSRTNNGFGGDYGTQKYDAEVDGRHNALWVYPNERCKRRYPFIFANALSNKVMKVTIYISNEFIRITNDQGCDEEMCSDCLFALNGQYDCAPGGTNQEIYIALNRVVYNGYFNYGYGVCKATLSWMCPWPIECPDKPCEIVDPFYPYYR